MLGGRYHSGHIRALEIESILPICEYIYCLTDNVETTLCSMPSHHYILVDRLPRDQLKSRMLSHKEHQ